MSTHLKIQELGTIIGSRITFFTRRKEEFVKERRRICKTCPLNSKFKEKKSFKDYLLSIVNTFTPYCTVCGCGIKFKTSVPSAECGLADIGEKPKWIEYGN